MKSCELSAVLPTLMTVLPHTSDLKIHLPDEM